MIVVICSGYYIRMSLSLYKYKYDDDVYDDNVNYDDYDVFDDKVDYDDYNAYDDYDLGGGSWYKLMKANWERAWRIKVATSKVSSTGDDYNDHDLIGAVCHE